MAEPPANERANRQARAWRNGNELMDGRQPDRRAVEEVSERTDERASSRSTGEWANGNERANGKRIGRQARSNGRTDAGGRTGGRRVDSSSYLLPFFLFLFPSSFCLLRFPSPFSFFPSPFSCSHFLLSFSALSFYLHPYIACFAGISF